MYDFFFLLSKAMLNQMAESSFDDKRSDAILFFFHHFWDAFKTLVNILNT